MLVVILSSTGNTELPNKFDVVRVDLQPSEQYKSVRLVVHTCMSITTHTHNLFHIHAHIHKMVLAGLRPEVIMEICSRAISFWTYQVSTRTPHNKVCLYYAHVALFDCATLKEDIGTLVLTMLCNMFPPQAHQERAYQKFCATKAVEKAQQQEGYYEQLVAVNQSEMACILTLCNTSCTSSRLGTKP